MKRPLLLLLWLRVWAWDVSPGHLLMQVTFINSIGYHTSAEQCLESHHRNPMVSKAQDTKYFPNHGNLTPNVIATLRGRENAASSPNK